MKMESGKWKMANTGHNLVGRDSREPGLAAQMPFPKRLARTLAPPVVGRQVSRRGSPILVLMKRNLCKSVAAAVCDRRWTMVGRKITAVTDRRCK